MSMKYFITLDEAFHIGMLLESPYEPEGDYIEVSYEEYIQARQYAKFNPETRVFTETLKLEPIVSPHEKMTEGIKNSVDTTSDDLLTTMELHMDTNAKVDTTQSDALTIMEYQTILDEKLNKIIAHLGL
ncbi:hypothetical protein [Zhenhengia yiwuensis]|uniref:Uncharacterized protein n=1 Tax=Zhenhengia yiwuensis TaxID=2763666 RepID=A0A926IFS9_9FIRM|nr:hypothetical protein [Zhenhengia yiwuensis]MBC8580866.1 hypothetical protein [Zhenhengia yiwuensis]